MAHLFISQQSRFRNEDSRYSWNPTEPLAEIGKHLVQNTKYPILSMRQMYPDRFKYPLNSLEAKKAILLGLFVYYLRSYLFDGDVRIDVNHPHSSPRCTDLHSSSIHPSPITGLSPMLNDSEDQRKKDSAATEAFTRCKSGKGRGRYSGYEYTDMDTQQKLSYEEYEKRYIMHVNLAKIKAQQLTGMYSMYSVYIMAIGMKHMKHAIYVYPICTIYILYTLYTLYKHYTIYIL